MSNLFESGAIGLGSNSADPVMAAIDGAEQSDELRFAAGIGSGGDRSDIDIEGLVSTAEESDLLLVPQNAPGALSVGKEGDKVSGESSELGKDRLTGDTGDSTVGEMDALTGGNDEVEIETRARKRDKAGNSRKKARNLGVLNEDKRFKEFVGKSDRKDFYKFRVKEKTDVDIELRGLSGNADLYLLNNKGKVIEKSKRGGKRAEEIDRTLNPGTYYVRVQPRNRRINANYNLSLEASNPHFHVDEPIVINIVDTAADAPASLDDSSTIDLMVAYTPKARLAEGGTNAINDLIEFAVDDANEAFAKSGVKSQLRLVHTAEVDYTESGKSSTQLERLQDPSDGYMDTVHALRDDYGADIVSLFVSDLDDAGGIGYVMGTPAYGFESHAFNIVTNYNAKNRHTLAHEIGHNLGLAHDRDNASVRGPFNYGYGYTTPSGVGTIMSYARNRIPYFSNPAISYNGEALGRTNLENSALAINQVAEYAANWRQSVDGTTQTITVNSPNGGNTLETGKSYTVTWNDNIDENVKLELYKGGSFNRTIISSTSSDGSYSWTVPTSITDGSDYKIKITSVSDSEVSDLSDSNFTIKPDDFITVNSPNGGNTLEKGKSYTISWKDNISENVKLELYKGGSFNRTISGSTSSDGSYSWTVPASITDGSDYRVKIISVNQSGVYDYSDNNFTIEPTVPELPEIAWTKLLGSSSSEIAYALSTDSDGFIYVSGNTFGNLDEGINSGLSDIFIIKYQPDGSKVWTSLLGGSEIDEAKTLTIGNDGSIYLSGNTYSDLDGQTNSGESDALIAKYQADGTKVWTKLLGSSDLDFTEALSVDKDGSIYVSGNTSGNLDGQTNSGGRDAFITKYEPDGTKVWTRLLGSSSDEFTSTLTIGSDGSIYVSGNTSGNLDGQINSGGRDTFIAKYQPDGSKVWTKLLENSGSDLTIDRDGSIYVSGWTYSSLDGQSNSGGADAFITKYQSDYTRAWTKLWGTQDQDLPNTVSIGSDGSIYVGGYTKGNLDGQVNSGSFDAFITKYEPDGTKVWTKLLGTSSWDEARILTSDSDGSIYISGQTRGDLDGQTNSGKWDAFITKLIVS